MDSSRQAHLAVYNDDHDEQGYEHLPQRQGAAAFLPAPHRRTCRGKGTRIERISSDK
jgi:hypothetical protein